MTYFLLGLATGAGVTYAALHFVTIKAWLQSKIGKKE